MAPNETMSERSSVENLSEPRCVIRKTAGSGRRKCEGGVAEVKASAIEKILDDRGLNLDAARAEGSGARGGYSNKRPTAQTGWRNSNNTNDWNWKTPPSSHNSSGSTYAPVNSWPPAKPNANSWPPAKPRAEDSYSRNTVPQQHPPTGANQCSVPAKLAPRPSCPPPVPPQPEPQCTSVVEDQLGLKMLVNDFYLVVVKYDGPSAEFRGADFSRGEEYLNLSIGERIRYLRAEGDWAFGQRCDDKQTSGWFPPSYVVRDDIEGQQLVVGQLLQEGNMQRDVQDYSQQQSLQQPVAHALPEQYTYQ